MRTYLGDGLYGEIEGQDVVLVTSDGVSDTNRIVLEPEVMAVFMHWTAGQEALRPIWNRYLMGKR